MSHRLFVGIDLPHEIRARLHALQGGIQGARWVAPENLHLTLRFIGEVDNAQAYEIYHALDRVEATPFELRLGDAGAFGSASRARTLWAGVASSPSLAVLKSRVDSALAGIGLGPDERRFSPHITLARLRSGGGRALGRRIAEIAPDICGTIPVDEFVLFESHLGGKGARYARAAVYPLADR